MLPTDRDGGTFIKHETTVAVDVEAAFDGFANHIGDWWPVENTFARIEGTPEMVVDIEIDSTAGKWFERLADGRVLAWGRVLQFAPPTGLTLTWQIGADGRPEPDPDKASTVEVRFDSNGPDSTTVTIIHRDFDRHGAKAAAIWREAMASSEGWPKFFERYRNFVESRAS